MRLTLRTLLAYRDRVLSPTDTEDLHRRIHLSHDAGNLLRRITALTERNDVLAPLVNDKGLGGDANAIAEYLDDALPHGQVPELERICLVSDLQLAELADCHTLLSTALNTKVIVPSELRSMANRLGDPAQRTAVAREIEARKAPRRRNKQPQVIVRPDAAHHSTPTASHVPVNVRVEAPMFASGGESIKPRGLDLETATLTHDVPEYLLGSSAGNWKLPLAIGALAALLLIIVWQSLGPWERVTELFAVTPTAPGASRSSPTDSEFDTISEVEQVPPGIAPASTPSTAPIAEEGVAGEGVEKAKENEIDEIDSSGEPPPGLALPAETTPEMSEEVISSNEPPPGLAGDGLKTAIAGASAATATTELAATPSPAPAPPQASPATLDGSRAVWLPANAQAGTAVMLHRDGDLWQRVEPGKQLAVGTQLVVPPFTRTTLDLPGGTLWTTCGPSLLQFTDGVPAVPVDEPVDEPVAQPQSASSNVGPRVETSLCRALVRGGPAGEQLALSTPLGDFRLQLTDPGSLVSIEVAYRATRAGSIIDRESTKPVLIIVAAEGGVEVSQLSPAGPTERLALADGIALVQGEQLKKFRLLSIPPWFRSSVDRPIDALAMADLHASLAMQQPAELGLSPKLTELTRSRRPETAALAVQVSMLCGDWQPLVNGFLDDSRMRSHWSTTLDLAGQLLASDPSLEGPLRASFSEKYGVSGDDQVDLLMGLPIAQLAGEGSSKLVQGLESTQLSQRVLASYQLQRLTGKSLGYQPINPMRSVILQWRRELASDRLKPLPSLDPVWESLPN